MHTYDIRSAIGSAALVGELGDIVAQSADATSTIERKANSNIAHSVFEAWNLPQVAVRRSTVGNGLPAERQRQLGGDRRHHRDREPQSDLAVSGQLLADAAGTTNNEDGVYNVLGYTGLRNILKGAGTSKTFVAGETHRRNLDALASQIDDDGGTINNLLVMLRHGARIAIQDELEDFVRISAGQVSRDRNQARQPDGRTHAVRRRTAALPACAWPGADQRHRLLRHQLGGL